MGLSSSSHRRNNQRHHTPSVLLSSSASPLPPPPSSLPPSLPSSSSSSSSSTLPSQYYGGSAPAPSAFPSFTPLSPPTTYSFAANSPYPPAPPPPHFYPQYSNYQSNFPFYSFRPHLNQAQPVLPLPPAPPPYVNHQETTTVRNDINLHKDTLRLEPDACRPDALLLTFTFDSLVDCSITIFYFAKEGTNCSFSPQYPDDYMPVTVPFQKGLNQKFRQPSGTGIDLGFFVLEDLAKPTPDDVYPLVISAESCRTPSLIEEQLEQHLPTANAQITEAVIEKQNDEGFHVKVIKQVLWVDGVRYELQELYGIEKSAEAEFDDSDGGKECVICMSEPKDTAVLPCRHVCMCSGCAKLLRLQTNRCPICRQPVEKLIEIKIKNDNK